MSLQFQSPEGPLLPAPLHKDAFLQPQAWKAQGGRVFAPSTPFEHLWPPWLVMDKSNAEGKETTTLSFQYGKTIHDIE